MNEMTTDFLSTLTILEDNGTDENSFAKEDLCLKFSLEYLSFIISVLGLIGNGIVIWFLSFGIKRNKFTIYILNLAVADFFCLLCSCVIVLCAILGLIDILYWGIIAVIHMLVYNTGLYLLTAISLERCLSALFPLWYHCQRPKHQSTIVCVLLWALSCLVTGIEWIQCNEMFWFHCSLSAFLSTNGLFFLFFTPLMVFSSLILLIKMQRSSQHRHPPKLYVVIMLTILIFLIFGLPLKLAFLFIHTNYYISNIVLCLALLLSVINSSANPYIYFLVGSQSKQRKRASIKVALQRVFMSEVEAEMNLNSNRVDTEV